MIPVDVVVRAGNCPCPGTPHSEEHVYLEPEATLPISIGAWKRMQLAEPNAAAQYVAIVNAYIPAAIRSWSFLEHDENGTLRSVRITQEAAERLIPWDKGGYEVAETADNLYSGRVTAPLVARLQRSSPTGPTASSTSPNRPSGSAVPKRSRRSSQDGSAGKLSAVPVP